MTNKSPIFPIPQHPHHFSDYGFDPQMDYLQVLEEAKKHKKEKFLPSSSTTTSRSVESLHFKLQKPISKEESKKKKQKSKWWKNALLFCKKKWVYQNDKVVDHHFGTDKNNYMKSNQGSSSNYRGTISGPIYITESRSGSSTPCRSTSGPLSSSSAAWTLIPATKNEVPYLNLREMNLDQHHRISTTTNPMPIYLVT
ncbi:hypothetical protein C5167_016737 [Papaver somniferum]|uniref:uncharacterized protein LOC113345601 n=1 Tax=Papaver somniferum TaxID=3469 RepID=UPI000E6F64BB|nr:uncharacterized protein LOC113345601 [Papaver somniferum]RZC94042.1 hypothetical protein C5167_016737 [Papaver somniferum]